MRIIQNIYKRARISLKKIKEKTNSTSSLQSVKINPQSTTFYLFFFFISVGCPGQLTRTTTIPHGPLNILQAQ